MNIFIFKYLGNRSLTVWADSTYIHLIHALIYWTSKNYKVNLFLGNVFFFLNNYYTASTGIITVRVFFKHLTFYCLSASGFLLHWHFRPAVLRLQKARTFIHWTVFRLDTVYVNLFYNYRYIAKTKTSAYTLFHVFHVFINMFSMLI